MYFMKIKSLDRYIFLSLACLSSIGNYFIMDSPALLKS